MSWALKAKILERQGKTREQALEELIQELDEKNRAMDIKLAKCIEHLPLPVIKDIFGDDMP